MGFACSCYGYAMGRNLITVCYNSLSSLYLLFKSTQSLPQGVPGPTTCLATMSYKGKERAKDVSAPSQSSTDNDHKATCIIIIGMAGSGKTTLVQRLNSHLHTRKTPPYLLNLDPAVRNLPYQANIDIRDTINYKEVMKQCVKAALP